MRVASLHIHPLKGGAIRDVERIGAAPIGLDGDRRWMIVDANGRFLTQREMPQLARLHAEPTTDGVRLSYDGRTHAATLSGDRADVVVWRSTVNAATVRPEDDAALSDWLGRPVRLVHHDARSKRATNEEWSDGEVAFPDGYPILVVLSASLDALNERLIERGDQPVPMSRFRPNVVIDGATPWEDDGWATIRVGAMTLDLVKPCARCTVTTVDQERGAFSGDEPLRTLRALRMSADRRVPGVLFGWNAVARNEGTLRVGDGVEVLERRSPWAIRGRETATAGLPF